MCQVLAFVRGLQDSFGSSCCSLAHKRKSLNWSSRDNVSSAFLAALELLKATDCRTVKVYQALSDIVSCNLYHLTCKLGPSHDAVRSYADLTYQWEQLLKLAPHHVQLTLSDNFQGLIREVCCASSKKLEVLFWI
jgi:hypothetical protein